MAGATTLVINILADAADAQKALKQTEGAVGGLGESTRNMGKVVAAGAAAGAAALVALGVDAFNAAEESARIGRETERVIKSTGAAAWISADQVGQLATAISDKTGADDEAIQSGENLLLTFTNVQNAVGEGNNVFDRATEAALDMSTALGTDMSGASIQLGKALNDPIKGLTALSKAGVSFTQDQKDQIKVLQESGDVLGAQKIILGEVEKEFKGAAEAAGTPFDKLKVALGNLQEDIGAKLIPVVQGAATVLLGALGPALETGARLLSDYGEAVKFLASVGLTGLAAAYVPVISAQALLIGQGVVSWVQSVVGYLGTLGTLFLETAASEGVLAAASGVLSLTLLPITAAVAVVGGALYALTRAMDTSSQAADDFYKQIQEHVDVSSFDSIAAGSDQVQKRIRDLRRSIDAGSGLGDLAASAADLLIPFHDVENSLRDQQNEVTTLTEKEQAHNRAVTDSKNALDSYATANVLAANGLEGMSHNAQLAAIETQGLAIDIGAVTGELEAIAKSKGIDPVQPGAVDKITALYEKTKLASTSTLQMSDAQDKFNDAASTAKDKVDAYKQSLDALTGAHMSAAAAETNYSSNSLGLIKTLNANAGAVRAMTDQTDASKASSLEQAGVINTNNKAIQDNVKAALDLASATYQEQQGRVGSTKALELASVGLAAHRDQLIKVMVQMGYNETQAQEYIDRLGLTPANITTQMHLNNGQANKDIADTQGRLISASGVYTATLNADTNPAEIAIAKLLNLYKGAVNEARDRALAGTRAIVPSSPGAVVPMPQPVGRAATTAAPSFSITINSTGLGADSPKIQRDIVGALTRWTQREGALRVPVSS